jgi:hypothetical protein
MFSKMRSSRVSIKLEMESPLALSLDESEISNLTPFSFALPVDGLEAISYRGVSAGEGEPRGDCMKLRGDCMDLKEGLSVRLLRGVCGLRGVELMGKLKMDNSLDFD